MVQHTDPSRQQLPGEALARRVKTNQKNGKFNESRPVTLTVTEQVRTGAFGVDKQEIVHVRARCKIVILSSAVGNIQEAAAKVVKADGTPG